MGLSLKEDPTEFSDLGLPISKSEYLTRRPDGYTAEINMPTWVSRFKLVCDLVEKYHPGGTILEIGSYRYNLTSILELKGHKVIGIDKDTSKMSEYIQQEELDIRECDIEREELPFDDRRFPIVIFTEVFEHLRINPLQTLRNIERVIKKDGVFIISTPNLYYIMNIVSFLLGRGIKTMCDGYEEFARLDKKGYPGHIRVYTLSEMKKFLTNTGFSIVDTFFAGTPQEGKRRLLRPICRIKPELMTRMYLIATPNTRIH